MDKIGFAKQLLQYYQQKGLNFDSKLKERDYKKITQEKTFLKVFKRQEQQIQLTEQLAVQIICYDQFLQYEFMLTNLYHKTSKQLSQSVAPKQSEYHSLATIDLLRRTCSLIVNTYYRKKDTPDFDKQVLALLEIFNKHVVKDASQNHQYKLTNEERQTLLDFLDKYKIKNNQKQKTFE